MKLNPVYKKELKLSVRSKKLPIIIALYNAILTLFSLMAVYAIFGEIEYGGGNYSSVLRLYIAISVMQIILVVFIVPSLTAGSIAGEREKQTLEILLTTKLSSGQIIRGKLLSSISDLILVVLSSIPVMSIVFSIGGVSIQDLCQLILMIVVTAILAGSIGICMSACFKKTMTSTIYTYAVILIFGIAYPLFVILLNNIASANGWNVNLGFLSYICLLHPGVTLGVMMVNQFSSADILAVLFTRFGVTNTWVANHWFWLSLVAQLAVSMLFLWLAQKVLNPIKKPKKLKSEKFNSQKVKVDKEKTGQKENEKRTVEKEDEKETGEKEQVE